MGVSLRMLLHGLCICNRVSSLYHLFFCFFLLIFFRGMLIFKLESGPLLWVTPPFVYDSRGPCNFQHATLLPQRLAGHRKAVRRAGPALGEDSLDNARGPQTWSSWPRSFGKGDKKKQQKTKNNMTLCHLLSPRCRARMAQAKSAPFDWWFGLGQTSRVVCQPLSARIKPPPTLLRMVVVVYPHTYIYIYTILCISIYIDTYVCVCVCTCMHIDIAHAHLYI